MQPTSSVRGLWFIMQPGHVIRTWITKESGNAHPFNI